MKLKLLMLLIPQALSCGGSGGQQHCCAILYATRAVKCWGNNGSGRATPPAGKDVAAGYLVKHTARRRPDNITECHIPGDITRTRPLLWEFLCKQGRQVLGGYFSRSVGGKILPTHRQ